MENLSAISHGSFNVQSPHLPSVPTLSLRRPRRFWRWGCRRWQRRWSPRIQLPLQAVDSDSWPTRSQEGCPSRNQSSATLSSEDIHTWPANQIWSSNAWSLHWISKAPWYSPRSQAWRALQTAGRYPGSLNSFSSTWHQKDKTKRKA